jgi:hypothetical protein
VSKALSTQKFRTSYRSPHLLISLSEVRAQAKCFQSSCFVFSKASCLVTKTSFASSVMNLASIWTAEAVEGVTLCWMLISSCCHLLLFLIR